MRKHKSDREDNSGSTYIRNNKTKQIRETSTLVYKPDQPQIRQPQQDLLAYEKTTRHCLGESTTSRPLHEQHCGLDDTTEEVELLDSYNLDNRYPEGNLHLGRVPTSVSSYNKIYCRILHTEATINKTTQSMRKQF